MRIKENKKDIYIEMLRKILKQKGYKEMDICKIKR